MAQDESALRRKLRAEFVQRAIETDAPLMAGILDLFAKSHGLDWPQLAREMGCSDDALNRVACCAPPRPQTFQSDIQVIAEAGGISASSLIPVFSWVEGDSKYDLVAEPSGLYRTDE